ncbi:DUF1330 domain-containing protein [Mycolicibacterium mageritense]|uniref:DUF1330 domain-containing protein n=1 Tax=Mycolicibacterium mageritense TaxID=53462 RepID=UPI0011D9F716|nr:DUF1330 domain-containing protein [Mycolicibacterium mageritense]TXI64586.1 MAG: DUF1330 domain-containing protein [Mycolicibacterium mageritense]
MSAFVISEVRFVDAEAAKRYMVLAEASIARHGGRYVVRGAVPDVPEGDWDEGRRVVVVEFPTMETLTNWYASDDYAEALTIRGTALERRLLFVPGVDGN